MTAIRVHTKSNIQNLSFAEKSCLGIMEFCEDKILKFCIGDISLWIEFKNIISGGGLRLHPLLRRYLNFSMKIHPS